MKRIFTLAILLIVFSCNDSELDCSTVLCAANEESISLRFLDWDTHANLLDNESIDDELISVTLQSQSIEFTIHETATLGKILVFQVPEGFGDKEFSIIFNDATPLMINLTTSPQPQNGCCGPYTAVDNIEVINYTNGYTDYGTLPLDINIYIE
ncbi:hypothetical protein [Flagellimonas okinawensis]|uniref:Uncharacterized protein n=1 Tax=Flagellimonas okinawensis TaxID=3031324 RepID=A0ABT5XTE1_9FLAO|nr:hypothetical protein [[Muricauda] okinawensis]MDF0709134.1 hypothetical protein [[Muricauda] okinawensis]